MQKRSRRHHRRFDIVQTMTIYEQMQSAVKYIEENLFSVIRVHAIARHVHMSTRSFYNYFWAVCGYTCKE